MSTLTDLESLGVTRMSAEELDDLGAKILASWRDVVDIRRFVPARLLVTALRTAAGSAADIEALEKELDQLDQEFEPAAIDSDSGARF